MLDDIRTKLFRAIEPADPMEISPLPKLALRRLNRLLGSPLCSQEELAKRRAAQARLASGEKPAASALPSVAAPVVVYFEKDRNQRMLDRVCELLDSRGIAYRTLDVTGDEATLAFVTREAKCEEDDLPIVYVAGTPVGGYTELVDWDVSGKLNSAVFG
jgi:glutaredoxin